MIYKARENELSKEKIEVLLSMGYTVRIKKRYGYEVYYPE